jgi:hypothetical protein
MPWWAILVIVAGVVIAILIVTLGLIAVSKAYGQDTDR